MENVTDTHLRVKKTVKVNGRKVFNTLSLIPCQNFATNSEINTVLRTNCLRFFTTSFPKLFIMKDFSKLYKVLACQT